MPESRIAELFDKYYSQTATPAEEEELMQLIAAGNVDPQLLSLMKAKWDALENLQGDATTPKEMADRILDTPQRSRTVFMPRWIRYAAAVVILLGATWIFVHNTRKDEHKLVSNDRPAIPHDVMPAGNKAVLTLSDGTAIVLDSASNGELAMQGGTRINKTIGGRIVYAGGNAEGKMIYNTMTTPRGGQYSVVLPDGSTVWLNAASSIRYPTAFIGNERKVFMTGEAYFEVSKDASKPFIVETGSYEVKVVGTAFNINAYTTSTAVRTSLVHGSVKIADKMLKPGEAYAAGKITPTNLDQDVAWKNGIFNFHKRSLKEVMDELERWYDVTVIYENDAPQMLFYGEMGRDLTLSQVLAGLQGTGVNFSITDGNKILVKNMKQ